MRHPLDVEHRFALRRGRKIGPVGQLVQEGQGLEHERHAHPDMTQAEKKLHGCRGIAGDEEHSDQHARSEIAVGVRDHDQEHGDAKHRRADTAPADSLAAQVTSENPLAAQYADTILRRIVCCDTPDTLENYPDSATRDLLRHHPFRLERLRTPQRYIGLEARRARAGALAEELEALAERTRTAAQTEQNLKTAYDQYQNFQRGTAPQQLAGLLSAVFGMVAGSLAPQMVRNTRAPHHRVVGVE